jgi:hypothetical protein
MKIVPVKQGGVLNYLGKQKIVSAPIKWRSAPDHPLSHLVYITDDEIKLLIKKDLHNSMPDGKANLGPAGLRSLNGGGGGSEGAGSDSGGGGSDSTDSGDMGSEAANDASTNAGNASVGGDSTDSFGGYDPDAGFTTSPQDQVDTGDLGSEAANDAATASGADSVGKGTFSSYSQIGSKMTNIANYMKGNPGTTLGLNAISALTGIPGLSLAYAVNSIYGTPATSTSTSSANSENSGGGDSYNESQISQILTQVANQYTGPSAAKNFTQQYPSSTQSGTLSFQSAYNTAKQNLGSLLTAPMSPYGNNAVSASPFYDYLKKNNLDRGIL